MGLFGLFDKKNCAFCGKDIGLMGNRKLEDGNMCKACAEKLSPWFSERRHSTVAEIARQLAMREENYVRFKNLRPSVVYGDGRRRLYLDEQAGQFVITSEYEYANGNPDVIDYGSVTRCEAHVSQFKRELRRKGPDGKEVPYNPPRYEVEFDFEIRLNLDHPYIDDMRFTLNDGNVKWDDPQRVAYYQELAEGIEGYFMGVRPDLSRFLPVPPPMMMDTPFMDSAPIARPQPGMNSEPVMRPQPRMDSAPAVRPQPRQEAPAPQPAMRPQPRQEAPAQPAMRPQPRQEAPAQPAMRPQPRQEALAPQPAARPQPRQEAPAQPAMRPQPRQEALAPQPAARPQPRQEAPAQPAARPQTNAPLGARPMPRQGGEEPKSDGGRRF